MPIILMRIAFRLAEYCIENNLVWLSLVIVFVIIAVLVLLTILGIIQ